MELRVQMKDEGSVRRSYRLALSALNGLPDHSALDLSDVAKRIGADKLDLIQWMRADIDLARLLASKLST